MNRKLLIVATVPPPIGGVTIHIKRLFTYLDAHGFKYKFVDINRSSKLHLVFSILSYKYIHFHTSNPIIRCMMVLLGLILFKKIIFTYHGNLGQYNDVKNFIDRVSVKMVFIPVVLNNTSFQASKKINENAVLIPAFIPPLENEFLKESILADVDRLKRLYKYLFVTNAHRVALDRTGQEIYQISLLVNIFNEMPDHALIISDPSGKYLDFFAKNGVKLSDNILIISEAHSFYEILKKGDVLLRITTTDGDSLSVKEALYLGKVVIATNVVNRPEGVLLTGISIKELKEVIMSSITKKGVPLELKNGAEALLELYKANIH